MRLLFLLLFLSSALLPSFASTLTTAISKGETDKAMNILLRDPKLVSDADEDGSYPIHLAIYAEEEELLEAIINAGSPLEIHDAMDSTPLLCALETGNSAMVNFLVNKGADVKVRDAAGQGVLAYDIDVESQELLLEKGASVNIADFFGVTPLMRAMQINNTDMVKFLASHGADFSARDNHNSTVLHHAASSANIYFVMMTIAMKGGNTLNVDDDGATPLTLLYRSAYPVEEGDDEENFDNIEDALALFNERQLAELHKELGENITNSYIAISRIFLNRGANINHHDEDGNTPLMIVARNGRLDLVRFLIAQEARLDIYDDNGETAMFHAVSSGNLELLGLMISKKGDINQKNETGEGLLEKAIIFDHIAIVEYLLSEVKDVNATNQFGMTPLMTAVSNSKNIEIVNMLLENGAEISLQDINGNTALHFAAESDNSEAVTLLLAKGAKWDAANKKGQSAIEIALVNNSTNALKTICKFAGIPVPKRKK